MKKFRYRLPWGLIFLLVLAILLTACGGNQAAPSVANETANPVAEKPAQETNGKLTILEWAGYDAPEYWQPFAEKHPDTKVDFSYFAEDAEALTKVQSGYAVDLVHPCSSWFGQYVELGLIQPIDTTRLKNWSGVNPELAKLGQIDGKQYLIPWDWGFESLLIRTDKVQQKPTSWADLWNPEYKGHVSIFDSGEATWIITASMLGFDPYNTTPEQQAQIKQKLIELKPNLLNYWTDSTELAGLISAGDVWVAGDAWQDIYFTTKNEGVPVEYITPKEGRLSFVCGYALSSQSKNVDLAYDYIDAALAPQSMANMSNAFAYGASNFDALPMIDPAIVKEFNLDNPDVLKDTIFYQALTADQRKLFTSVWSDVKAAP
jgi:spermidine/putrescine transport system substrate-binding protein